MVQGMKGDPSKCPSFGTPNGPQPEAEPGTPTVPPPPTKSPEELKRHEKKVLGSKVISALGLLLAFSEIAVLVMFQEIDPFFVLLWVVSSAGYITCAFMSYMSDLEGWSEWPVVTFTSLIGTLIPVYLTLNYSMRWPQLTGSMDSLLYSQVIYGPTVYLGLCFFASKVYDEEDKEEETKERQYMERVVNEQKDNMRDIMAKVDHDDVKQAMASAVAKMDAQDKKTQ